ncbi:13983_t:CDS:2 [Gigaspora margarita]|uniref:13983_t:CDS:1 n=1 Tax=Gigaspora margarita TaxID=4874 RepID=A0ABN7V212_GIGMA|nr:13983_t:CDS:2 [Gigaspora margarita]
MSEDTKFDKVAEVYDNIAAPLENALEIAETVATASKFIPLLREIAEFAGGLIELYQNAKYNRRICGVLMIRIQSALASIKSLEIYANDFPESTDFFTPKNNALLRNFQLVMKKIEEFIKKIQNINNYRLFFQANSIKQEFEELTKEFDDYMTSLNFKMIVDMKQQSKRDLESINKDTNDMKMHLQSISESVNFSKEQINQIAKNKSNDSELLQKISISVQNIENFTRIKNAYDKPEKQALIGEEIITSVCLNYYDFIVDNETPIRGKVRKWHYKPFGEYEVALKELESNKNKPEKLELQVGILKTINESRDIIQYLGLVTMDSKQYLVTEWAEYGTLREYYEKKNPDITVRSRLALEIARGLNYLEAYKIYHHDVRSENILVDYLEHAKITNFELSRGFSEAIKSKSIDLSMENVRYMAPEKIKERNKIRYNSKCEVFSFGMLLWELAEQKLPFSDTGLTVLAISQLIIDDTMNLKFSSPDVPDKWKSLVYDATRHKPNLRPEMKDVLRNIKIINESINTVTSDESELFDDLSLEEAIEHSKRKNGSKDKAWESIVKYSELNDFTAKFWKGFYLYHKLINFQYSDEERIQLAAKLFKEAADGANLKEAQYMYASCIYKDDPITAIKYFEKAAEQNHTAAMHNLGLLYYHGKKIDVDKEKGKYWFKRAADGDLDASIVFCKKNGIRF